MVNFSHLDDSMPEEAWISALAGCGTLALEELFPANPGAWWSWPPIPTTKRWARAD
ncbi:hypothetical protein OL239_00945 [Arthrobacter sp. ATA002]|uniref:hypothetical protein n=1 Tax=Arthrobacter sp. ATA002 TaxID=2991715 RepID=UPI0022A733FB|nr:hypothetical protein [Arthrobacter sp. ATA002]WAP51951.1 hypothetical protein OL239_00945 [Arthrobacter sp. ATA002]